MEKGNQSTVTVFMLLGISDDPDLQKALFSLFFFMYNVGVLGNSVIFYLITQDTHLHSPMYFFIGNLAVVDLSLMTVTVPKLLLNIANQTNTISFSSCITQLYFFLGLVTTEGIFMGVMSYDRYVAICNPLRYTLLMSNIVCIKLASSSWLTGFLNSALHSGLIAVLRFCGPNQIPNFFCDIPPLLKLSCSETSTNELMLFTEANIIILCCVFTILVSYVCIIATILKIRSSEGRRKAFSTCSSHLIVVTLFYTAVFFTYIRPASSYSLQKDKVASIVYTVITPMVNPFIYSLRNKQVKDSLHRAIKAKYLIFLKT